MTCAARVQAVSVNEFSGVNEFLARQEAARRRKEEKEQALVYNPDKWKPKKTKPQAPRLGKEAHLRGKGDTSSLYRVLSLFLFFFFPSFSLFFSQCFSPLVHVLPPSKRRSERKKKRHPTQEKQTHTARNMHSRRTLASLYSRCCLLNERTDGP